MKEIKKMLMLLCMSMLVFQGCSEDDSTGGSGGTGSNDDTIEVAGTYSFNGRFDDTGSSVSYSGQVVRNLLISGIKSMLETGNAVNEDDLTALYNNASAGDVVSGVAYTDISSSKLENKIASSTNTPAFPGTVSWGGSDYDPQALMEAWFAAAESATANAGGWSVGAGGLHMNQMIGKGLLGMVSYWQGSTVYFNKVMGTTPFVTPTGNETAADNSMAYVDDNDTEDDASDDVTKAYTSMEHYWDEAFGYFGAALDYGDQDNSTRRESGSASTADEYKQQVNYDWAKYAAKRGFDDVLWNAFYTGRALITAEASTIEIQEQIDIIVEAWEKLIAANIVHYANDVAGFIVDDAFDCSSDDTCQKYWSEMRAFGLCMQFNAYSTFAAHSDYAAMLTAMGETPPDAAGGAAFKEGVTATNAAFQTHFGFTDAEVSSDTGF